MTANAYRGISTPMNIDALLTTAQAAAELGVTRIRVLQLIGAGKIKTIRIGRLHLITRAEVERAKKRRTRPGRKPQKI